MIGKWQAMDPETVERIAGSHTPEPWNWLCFQQRTGSDFPTHGILVGPPDVPVDKGTAFTAGDARRIVACVNACKGIPTAALDNEVIIELIDACKGALDVLNGAEVARRNTILHLRHAIIMATGKPPEA